VQRSVFVVISYIDVNSRSAEDLFKQIQVSLATGDMELNFPIFVPLVKIYLSQIFG